MNKRQEKKKLKNAEKLELQNKSYRKTEKKNQFKTQKSNSERQKDYVQKEKAEGKKRTSLYITEENLKKISDIQKLHLLQHKKKISKSDAINMLMSKI